MLRQRASLQGDERVEKHFMSILARVWQRSPVAPEGLAASGGTLGDIARLAPEQALVCTENLNPNVVVMKSAKDCV